MDIHRSQIRDFVLPKINSVFVVDYYLTIHSILSSSEDLQYKGILANPRIRTQNEIIWATESFLTKPVLLCNLLGNEKDYYADILVRAIHSVERLSSSIKSEDGGEASATLLRKALSYVDEGSVYCADGKIVIVNWGMMPRTTDVQHCTICRKGQLIGSYAEYLDKEDYNEEIRSVDESIHQEFDGKLIDDGSSLEINDKLAFQAEDIATSVDEETVLSDLEQEQAEEQMLEEADASVQDDKCNEADEKSPVEVSDPELPEEKDKKKSFTALWKIPVLLLLLLALMFLTRGCHGPISVVNPFYNPLPSVPTVLPIYDDYVGESIDGMSLIALDRLNIYLDQKGNPRTMLKWARAFKRAYPGKEYEITYYDKELDILQIMVPSSEREVIKNSLPGQLSEFSFEVYEEAVYGADSQMSDPMMSDPSASWYFDPIDAEGAWEISTGNSDVVIAVVDNGFDASHPEFKDRIYKTHNILTHKSSVFPIRTENGIDGHGTHVAATVAGNCNNGLGLTGIAPECRLMLVQVGTDSSTGLMSSMAVIDGVKYAIDHGADVINISLGQCLSYYEQNLPESMQLNYIKISYRQEEAIWEILSAKAEAHKCVLVFAAGNNDVVSGMDPKKRNNSTIIVSALDESLNKVSFSNYGIYPHLGREYSTVSAPGVNIYSATPNESFSYMNGTSMAAPIVSGSVALLKSLDRNLNSHQVIHILKETGVNVGDDIGPMINIGKAVHLLNGEPDYGRVNCQKISKEIKKLRRQLDSLTHLCPEAAQPDDTLKFDDVVKNPTSLDGLWKVTTSLVSSRDQSPVEIFMEFQGQDGRKILINKGIEYSAPLKVEITDNTIFIKQLSDARAENGDTFIAFNYSCSTDRNGNLLCSGISAYGDKLEFNLVRV